MVFNVASRFTDSAETYGFLRGHVSVFEATNAVEQEPLALYSTLFRTDHLLIHSFMPWPLSV